MHAYIVCGKQCIVPGIWYIVYGQNIAAILKWIEYGLYKEYIGVLSKIVFYLLQDGCNRISNINISIWEYETQHIL